MSPHPPVTASVEQEGTPHASSRSAERIARRYLAVILAIAVSGILFPFAAERTPLLQDLSASRYGHILDYSYQSSAENANIVIFGDSSALYGVDTTLLSSQLGLKVINLPGTMGSLPVTGDLPLRRYLSHNQAPALIVFYVSPWNLDLMHSHNQYRYEGIEQIIRHGGVVNILRMARQWPKDFVYFPMHFYLAPSKFVNFLNGKPFQEPQMVLGHSPNPTKRALSGNCVIPDHLKDAQDTASLEKLLINFNSPKTKTIVYLSPLPECEGSQTVASRRYKGINIPAPAILPAHYFSDDSSYVHALADSTDTTTTILGTVLRRVLGH